MCDDELRDRTDTAIDFAERRRPRASAGDAGLVVLYARRFGDKPSAYALPTTDVVVGRDPDVATVCVPESSISREHVRIRRDRGQWILSDLGSRNGTLVDGRRVDECVLEDSCEIRVGDVVLKFVASGVDRYLRAPAKGRPMADLLGGAQIEEVASEAARIAATPLSCLLLGETGTGKEVLTRGIHALSGRTGSLQAINCAAIPPDLLESELFGYRRGAFSGATRDKPGLIALANGGTLFLDEIGDLPLEAQAKLLRVLQAREVMPLGGTRAEKVDIRIVSATHRDLSRLVAEQRFRGDLFARVSEHIARLPALRERKEDVALLVRHFTRASGGTAADPTFPAMLALLHYDWPFNVRELESCVKRAVALADGAQIDVAHLPASVTDAMAHYGAREQPAGAGASATALRRGAVPAEDRLRALLAEHHGNLAAVGRALGRERMQIHRWLKKYGIDLDDYRAPG